MRTVTIQDGLARDETGRVIGIVTAMEFEIETIDTLTPTVVRLLTRCPFCSAERGNHCRRWRGGARKANHAERIEAARSLA